MGLHNYNKIQKLNSFDLKIKEEKDIQNANQLGNKWIEFDSSNNCFIILYDNEYQFYSINDKNDSNK